MQNLKMSNSFSRRNSATNLKPSAPNTEKENTEHHKISDKNVTSTVMNFPDSKWIQIFVNGDEYFSGCQCVVNSKYYRNLDMFLNYLTERLKPSFGAIRNIYTPGSGHPVNKLEDLISKHKYVVAGNERFKKLESGYSDVIEKKFKRHGLKSKQSKFKISKAKPLCHNTLAVYIHQNGNFKVKPNKVNLLSQDLENLNLTLQKISETIKCGPIKRIYTTNGKPVQSVEDLKNNQTYIAIGKHEIFKPGQYISFIQNTNSSSMGKRYSRLSSEKSSSVLARRSSGAFSQTSQVSSGFTSSASKKDQLTYLEPPAYNSLNIAELGNGVESYDSNKSPEEELCTSENVKIKIDLDDDVSGIFRSKIQSHLTAGAAEVEDSSETVIDLPVDLLNADEVDDEITPDMERSLQHLSLDVPDEIVAYLPSMQNNSKAMQNSDERQVSHNKYNLNHSQTLDIQNIFV